jgi:integrase
LRESKLVESSVAWTKPKSDGMWMYPSPGSTIKGVPKEVALNSMAVEALQGDVPRISGRFFTRWANGHPISETFKDTCTRAGVHDLVFHDLRHTFGSWLIALGTDYVVVEKMLGHALPGTGELYMHEAAWAPRMREAVTKLEAYTRNLLANPETRAAMASRGHCPNTNQSLSQRKIS